MQLVAIEVKDLFDRFSYEIPLRGPSGNSILIDSDDPVTPSVAILLGPNGSGKTTILNMINGMLSLDFNVFRAVPFGHAALHFSSGKTLRVQPIDSDGPSPLQVEYGEHRVMLDPLRAGALGKDAYLEVDEFRTEYFDDTESLDFSLIDTHRFLKNYRYADFESRIRSRYGLTEDEYLGRVRGTPSMKSPAARLRRNGTYEEERVDVLAKRVLRFVNSAQVDYRTYFAIREPELFSRIIRRLVEPQKASIDRKDLLGRLSLIREADDLYMRLGLVPDRWNFDELANILSEPTTSDEALSAIGAYVDVFESRNADRKLVADRLLTFERLMGDFFDDIELRIDPEQGFRIEIAQSGKSLHDDQLSSGQYNLLYLMVSSLTTRRSGTVLAIDEPELSMHLSWQRKLIRALIECASGAEPQFIFSTHSPDLAANYSGSIVNLGHGDLE